MNKKLTLSRCAVALIGFGFAAFTSAQTLFSDNFDSQPAGSFPLNWSLRFNGAGTDQQVVDTTHVASAPNALKLVGSDCWSANAFRAAPLPSAPTAKHVTLRGKIFIDQIVSGGCGYGVAGMNFNNPSIGPWGTEFAGIDFETDGFVYSGAGASQVRLMPYTAQTWYDVVVDMDFASWTSDIYINGALVGSHLPIVSTGGVPTGVDLWAGHPNNPMNAKAWFDNVSLAVGSARSHFCCKDFNGDGKADILWRNSLGQLYEWWLNGTAMAGGGNVGGANPDWTVVGVGDFNGDGKADVLQRHSSGALHLWLMNGRTISSQSDLDNVSNDWYVAGIGDFNGDGRADILWRDSSGRTFEWLMDGFTILNQGVVHDAPVEWQVAGIGDFNGDGRDDILWRHTSGQLYEWLMNGLTIQSQGNVRSVALEWQIAGIGDFNGDGRSDILWRHTSGQVYAWLMNGMTILSQGAVRSTSNDWQIAGTGDFNGDGKTDILWRNATTGQVYEWLMDGVTYVTGGSPGSSTAEWQIQ